MILLRFWQKSSFGWFFRIKRLQKLLKFSQIWSWYRVIQSSDPPPQPDLLWPITVYQSTNILDPPSGSVGPSLLRVFMRIRSKDFSDSLHDLCMNLLIIFEISFVHFWEFCFLHESYCFFKGENLIKNGYRIVPLVFYVHPIILCPLWPYAMSIILWT